MLLVRPERGCRRRRVVPRQRCDARCLPGAATDDATGRWYRAREGGHALARQAL